MSILDLWKGPTVGSLRISGFFDCLVYSLGAITIVASDIIDILYHPYPEESGSLSQDHSGSTK